MKECDKQKSHISSKIHVNYIFSNNVRHPVAKTFTTLHPTALHFTPLHLSTLHFLPFKLHPTTLHYSVIWLNPTYVTLFLLNCLGWLFTLGIKFNHLFYTNRPFQLPSTVSADPPPLYKRAALNTRPLLCVSEIPASLFSRGY